MSAYRYVVFPPGAAVTPEELATLRRYSEQLNHHIALGTHRGDGGLAVACEAEPFDRLRALEPAFEELLTHWHARGGRVVEKLAFVKDAKAWKAVALARETKPPSPPQHAGHATTKPLDPREAEGRVRLAARQFTANVEAVERAAAWVPYLLWALGVAMVLGVGGYLALRLTSGKAERRSETIERAIEEVGGQTLTPSSTGPPPPSAPRASPPPSQTRRPPAPRSR